jgi:hypothetical protein
LADSSRAEAMPEEDDIRVFEPMEPKPVARNSFLEAVPTAVGQKADMGSDYIVAPSRKQQQHDVRSPANSLRSPSSHTATTSSQYQLMDDDGGRQAPDQYEGVQQGIQKVSRRVSDSWRNLQGSVKRMSSVGSITGRPIEEEVYRTKSARLLRTKDDGGEMRDEEESTNRRFLRQTVRSLKKQFGAVEEAGASTSSWGLPTSLGRPARPKPDNLVFVRMDDCKVV